MKRKRIGALLLAATVTLGMLAGCGSSDSNETKADASGSTSQVSESENAKDTTKTGNEDSEQETEIEPCEITVWHAMSEQQEKTLTDLTDQFNQENNYGIKVTLVNQGYYNDLSTKLTANAAADTLPDMTQAYNNLNFPHQKVC